MGKRELLLILGFAVVGTLVYFVTAPARPDKEGGFSFGRMVDAARREVSGNRASTEMTTNDSHPVPPDVNELRINIPIAQIVIIGEQRADIGSEFHVWSNGFDEAEAKNLAGQTRLKIERAGPSLQATVAVPESGVQRLRVTLHVPAHMEVQFEPTNGKLDISDVASVDHENARGETNIRQVPGRVVASHRGGTLTISDVGPLRLTTRGSDVKVTGVNGEAVLQVQAGDFRASDLGGPIELQANGADVVLEQLQKTRGPIRVNSIGGNLTVRGIRTDARIDGRDAEMDLTIDKASAIAIYNSGERIQLTPPTDGYDFDAVATNASITVPDEMKKGLTITERAPSETRATGKVNGGGPTITVRSARGEIRINSRAASSARR